MKPIVAIVGRPNVGKSTFFNRVTRSREALVDDFPGVTRDRHYRDASWNDIAFTLVDTGGFTEGDEFSDGIRFQIQQAIEDADVIIFLLDGKAGISPFERDIVALLRVTDKPVFYSVSMFSRNRKQRFNTQTEKIRYMYFLFGPIYFVDRIQDRFVGNPQQFHDIAIKW